MVLQVTSALYTEGIADVKTVNYVYGIGGRDVKSDDIEKVFADLQEIVSTGKVEHPFRYLGLKD